MRVPRTLYLYLGREILFYAAVGFLAITTVLVSQHLLRRLDDLVVVGLSGTDLVSVFLGYVPMLTAYSVPIAFVFGVSLALARLSSDLEVLAMRAGGLGLGALLAPSLLLALAVCALTAHLMIDLEPRTRRELGALLTSVAARGGVLEPGKFRPLLGRVIFVEERDRENRLRGVMISDRSNPRRPFLVFAERGRFRFDEATRSIHFRLLHGDLHLLSGSGDDESTRRIAFDSFDYSFDVSALLSGETTNPRPREMDMADLRKTAARLRAGGRRMPGEERPIEYELQLQRRLALPAAPAVFATLAVPLALLRRTRSARSWGTLVSACLVFGYYALLSFCALLAREGWVGAGPAVWAPNLAFGLAGGGLLWVARRGAGA
jgi:LPS export ABC transporter permease LptF